MTCPVPSLSHTPKCHIKCLLGNAWPSNVRTSESIRVPPKRLLLLCPWPDHQPQVQWYTQQGRYKPGHPALCSWGQVGLQNAFPLCFRSAFCSCSAIIPPLIHLSLWNRILQTSHILSFWERRRELISSFKQTQSCSTLLVYLDPKQKSEEAPCRQDQLSVDLLVVAQYRQDEQVTH